MRRWVLRDRPLVTTERENVNKTKNKKRKKVLLKLEDQRNAQMLTKLLVMLRDKPVTSHHISRRMKCSNMVARRRLQQLVACGYQLRVGYQRVGSRGPEARTYKLARLRPVA